MRPRVLATLLAAALFLGFSGPPPARAADCQFILGFAALHDQIPDIVGQCVDNETHNPINGDGLQQTTNGLLVWRKVDNFTAFTNGSQTWVNGPFYIQERPNDQRYWWEANPDQLPIIPTPIPGERCHTAELSLSVGQQQAGAGHVGAVMQFTNNTDVSCSFFGYVGAQLLDAQYNPLPTQVFAGGGYLFKDPGFTLVTVPAGGTAAFGLEWEDVPVGSETTCPESTYMAVTPPDEYAPIVIQMTAHACGGGTIHVTAVQPESWAQQYQ